MASNVKFFKHGMNMIKETDWRNLNPKRWNWQKIIWPFRVLVHPFNAFSEIKYDKTGSVPLSIVILLLWFFSNIYNFLELGFQFNMNRIENLDVKVQFMGSVMVIILWAVANWAICTLMDGEGRFREIWISTCYAVMPQVVSIVPLALISKALTREEGSFLTLFSTISFIWMVLLIFIANTVIHQYSFKRSLASMLLTLVGVFILLLLFVLIVSLFIQIWDFVSTIVTEIMYRI